MDTPNYIGYFRCRENTLTVTCSDGSEKVLYAKSNPISTGIHRYLLDGRKISNKEANKLWDRDKNNPVLTNKVG